MSEESKCRNLEKLPEFMANDEPLPDDFLEHARSCEHCLSWTSYSLAILVAINTTDRIISDENCPSDVMFSIILLSNFWRTAADKQENPDKDIYGVNPEGFIALYEAKEHLNGDNPDHCAYCREHHDTLFERVLKLQPEYEKSILAGEKVRPITKNKAMIVEARKFAGTLNKKPN